MLKINRNIKRMVLGAALASVSQWAMSANWDVSASESVVSVVSVKKDTIGEVHQFDTLTGSLSNEGAFTLNIDLASVNTGIEIRDQRMRDFLFETGKFAQATASGNLDSDVVGSLSPGESITMDLPFTLSLHGKTKSMQVPVMVSKLLDDKVLVSALKPVLINAADFDLTGGIDKLKELAALPSITLSVPVTFDLTLTR